MEVLLFSVCAVVGSLLIVKSIFGFYAEYRLLSRSRRIRSKPTGPPIQPEEPPIQTEEPTQSLALWKKPDVKFLLNGRRCSGFLKKRNIRTVWVSLANGRVIKRHIRKHAVTFGQ